MANSDQMRELYNNVHLAGALAELRPMTEGISNGVPWMKIEGVVRCGETPDYDVRFYSFVKSKKQDGSDSRLYKEIREWYDSAVPMTKDATNYTMVDMKGKVTDNPFLGKSTGEIVEGVQYNMKFFNNFTEYAADIDIEGCVLNIADEIDRETEMPSGRQRLRLMSNDFFHNVLDFKNIIIPEENVGPCEDIGYEKGVTGTFYISLIPHTSVSKKKSTGGFGVVRTNETRSHLEMVVVGADKPLSSENKNSITSAQVKLMMAERQAKLDEVKNNALARNESKRSFATSTPTASKINTKVDSPIEDDDFPF